MHYFLGADLWGLIIITEFDGINIIMPLHFFFLYNAENLVKLCDVIISLSISKNFFLFFQAFSEND